MTINVQIPESENAKFLRCQEIVSCPVAQPILWHGVLTTINFNYQTFVKTNQTKSTM